MTAGVSPLRHCSIITRQWVIIYLPGLLRGMVLPLTHSWRAGSRCRFLNTRVLSERLVMCRTPSQGKKAQKLKTTCFFSFMALIMDFLHIENKTRFCEELHLSQFFLAKGNDSFWKKLKFRLYT